MNVLNGRPNIFSTRSRISLPALLVNVKAIIDFSGIPFFNKCKSRLVNTRVFPDPAPAVTNMAPIGALTISNCVVVNPMCYYTTLIKFDN